MALEDAVVLSLDRARRIPMLISFSLFPCLLGCVVFMLYQSSEVAAFPGLHRSTLYHLPAAAGHHRGIRLQHSTKRYAETKETDTGSTTPSSDDKFSAAVVSDGDGTSDAVSGTVNQRLLAELQEAKSREKNGSSSSLSSKVSDIFGSSRKTDEERQQAILEARDLNGVNPVTAFVGGAVALAGALVFWELTQFLAEYFSMHPTSDDQVYFIARLSSVIRNVAIGLSSLASGFFGVTGIGILSLGIRVAYGVATGELDPTPKAQDNENVGKKVEFEEIWKFMTNQSKKRGQR